MRVATKWVSRKKKKEVGLVRKKCMKKKMILKEKTQNYIS